MTSYQDSIQAAFSANAASWKTPQQIYDAMKLRLAANPEALNVLNSYYAAQQQPNPSAPVVTTPNLTTPNVSTVSSMAGRKNIPNSSIKPTTPTVVTPAPNTSVDAIKNSGLDADTQTQLNSHVSAIHQQYDDKIKSHTQYADNVMSSYNAYKAELDPKYKQMRDQIDAMEKEMNSNYAQLKDAVAGNYASGMDSYTRQAAAAQAGISGTLSKSGISGGALANALSEAQYDPKRLAAIQALKDKQISDVTNLQQNYTNWANTILQNRGTLTTAEQQLAQTVLARKDKLDAELNDLKNSSIEDTYKPLLATLGGKSEAMATGEKINAQQNQTLDQYLAATPARKKDMLRYKLKEEGTDIGYIDEAMLEEALKRGSYPDALAYLSQEVTKRQAEAAAKVAAASASTKSGSSWTTPSPYSANSSSPSTSSTSVSGNKTNVAELAKTKTPAQLQAMIDTELKKGTSSASLKSLAASWGLSPDVMSQLKFDGTTSTVNTKKNVQSPESELQSALRWWVDGITANTATKLLNKLGNKQVPSHLKGVVAKIYAKSLWLVNNIQLERAIEQKATAFLNSSNSLQQLFASTDEIIKQAATKAFSIEWLPVAEKTILQKVAMYGSKSLSLLSKAWGLWAKVLGGPLSVAIGIATPQWKVGWDTNEVTDRVKSIINSHKSDIERGIVNIPMSEISWLTDSEKDALADQISLIKPYITS